MSSNSNIQMKEFKSFVTSNDEEEYDMILEHESNKSTIVDNRAVVTLGEKKVDSANNGTQSWTSWIYGK